MKLLFCHDHVFYRFEGAFYSPGKLDREKLDFYFNFFYSVTVVGRHREIENLQEGLFRTDVDRVSVVPLPNLASITGVLRRNQVTRELERLVDEVDCVIARVPSEIGLLAIKLATRVGKRLIIEVVASGGDCLKHRGDFLGRIYGPALDYRLRKALSVQSNVIYVTSEYLQSCYPSLSKVGVSDVLVRSVENAKEYPTREWRVGIVGNPDLKLKGIRAAILAISNVRSKGVKISLSVVGGTGQRYIQEHGSLPEFVTFEGVISSRQAMEVWFRSLSTYIQPSFTEGLPRALIEAMSFGIPCIGSDVGGIPELLVKDALFKAGDVLQIEQCVTKLLDRHEYDHLARHSQAKATEFLHDKLTTYRIEFYRSALASQSAD